MTDLSPETSAFLAEQRANDGPSHEDRRRIRERLMLQLGAAAFSTAAANSASALSNAAPAEALPPTQPAPAPAVHEVVTQSTAAKVVGAKLSLAAKFALSAAVLGGLGAITALQMQKPAVAAHVVSAPVPPTVVATVEPAVDEAPVVVAPVVADAPAKAPARKLRARPAEASAESIAEELALISKAQQALRRGQAQDVRSILREHATRFPAGTMRDERLGIDAMVRCADGEDGALASAEFLRVASGSPMASAVRKACKLP